MTTDNLNTPWHLAFGRDGTEDYAVILDSSDEELLRSRNFWLPEQGDPTPPTLAAVRLMHAAPKLLGGLLGTLFVLDNRIDDYGELERIVIDAAHAALAEALGGQS